jgi:hypothetical protein
MTAQVVEIGHNVERYRETAAKRIKELMFNWTANTLALAAELAQAAETFPVNPKRPDHRPGFIKWAKEAAGISHSQIYNLLQVHHKFGHVQHGGRARLAGNVLVLLSRTDVPASARIEVLDRAEKGEHIGRQGAKKIADKHKLPTPKQANQLAKEEGHPVLASNGYIYFGTDPAKAKEGASRRSMVFGVRDALKHLGNIHLTGREFLDYAFPHQLWTPEEATIIKAALRWLIDLDEAWDERAATTR